MSFRIKVDVSGHAVVAGADALGMRGGGVMASAGGADPIGAAVLDELTDGGEQCRGRRQLLL